MTMPTHISRQSLFACTPLVLVATVSAQSFVVNNADIPTSGAANNSHTENVDFGDVDLDGDWDAVFADGGDSGNDQNRLWVNQGGVQLGTIGVFEDRTSQQFPPIQDTATTSNSRTSTAMATSTCSSRTRRWS